MQQSGKGSEMETMVTVDNIGEPRTWKVTSEDGYVYVPGLGHLTPGEVFELIAALSVVAADAAVYQD